MMDDFFPHGFILVCQEDGRYKNKGEIPRESSFNIQFIFHDRLATGTLGHYDWHFEINLYKIVIFSSKFGFSFNTY
jgi:hypothetical protein